MTIIKKTPKKIGEDAIFYPWRIAVEPFRVAPHVYYVGNLWVGCFLIETLEGLVLIDTAISETLYLLLESIRKLGFDPMDIKKILITHAHFDHDGAATPLKEMTGAEIWLAKEEMPFKKDLKIPKGSDESKFVDYEPDCFYDDDKPIVMGDIRIRTKLTPGHTPGTTSFFVDDKDEEGKPLVWGMHGGVGVNTMNDAYFAETGLPSSLRDRFIEDCKKLKTLHMDICTPSHPAHSNMLQLVPMDRKDYRPFIDSQKWQDFLDERAEAARSMIGK